MTRAGAARRYLACVRLMGDCPEGQAAACCAAQLQKAYGFTAEELDAFDPSNAADPNAIPAHWTRVLAMALEPTATFFAPAGVTFHGLGARRRLRLLRQIRDTWTRRVDVESGRAQWIRVREDPFALLGSRFSSEVLRGALLFALASGLFVQLVPPEKRRCAPPGEETGQGPPLEIQAAQDVLRQADPQEFRWLLERLMGDDVSSIRRELDWVPPMGLLSCGSPGPAPDRPGMDTWIQAPVDCHNTASARALTTSTVSQPEWRQ